MMRASRLRWFGYRLNATTSPTLGAAVQYTAHASISRRRFASTSPRL